MIPPWLPSASAAPPDGDTTEGTGVVPPVSLPPTTPLPGLFSSAGVALAAAVAAVALRRVRTRLRPTGWLPDGLAVVETVARLVAALGVALVALSAVPSSLAPVLPYAGLALALAFGWSARDALPDLIAWVVLVSQGRVRGGRRVHGDGFSGRILAVGPLTTLLVDQRGERTSVPNRMFVGRPVTVSDEIHPVVEVVLPVPGVDAAVARRALREAALLSPWIAPDPAVDVGADPGRPDTWRVRVRVIEARYADAFLGSFPERVAEVLRAGLDTPHPSRIVGPPPREGKVSEAR